MYKNIVFELDFLFYKTKKQFFFKLLFSFVKIQNINNKNVIMKSNDSLKVLISILFSYLRVYLTNQAYLIE